jgi:hypothetical protein
MQPLAVARRTKWRPPLDQIVGGGGGALRPTRSG